jgi:hypothetical protein
MRPTFIFKLLFRLGTTRIVVTLIQTPLEPPQAAQDILTFLQLVKCYTTFQYSVNDTFYVTKMLSGMKGENDSGFLD